MPDEELIILPAEEGILILKAILKIAMIITLVISFSTISSIISLIICFIGYFSLPSSYKENRKYTQAQAVLRLVVGGVLAVFLGISLSYGGNYYGWAFAPLGFAFFFIFPKKKTRLGEEAEAIAIPDKLMFLVLMIASAVGIFTWLSLAGDMALIVGVIWIISLIAGLSTSRESRPGVGVLMISVSVLAYSFAFSGTVGTAMFGAWWPTIEQSSKIVTEPLGTAWLQASRGMEESWLMISCPSCYYEKKIQEAQRSSTLTSGGSVLAIEVNKMEFLSPEVDLQQPLAAYAELENRGEFTARNVQINLTLPQKKDETGRGKLVPVEGVSRKFESCSGGEKGKDSCFWGKASYPGDVKLVSFKYADDKKWDDLGKCRCLGNDGKKKGDIGCNATETCGKKYPTICDESKTSCTKDYEYGGKFLTFGFDYSFNYNVNVSLVLDVMDKDLLEKKLINKEITLKNEKSQRTGGPVETSIYTERQPVRNGEATFGVIYITNKGLGKVLAGATYDLYIPAKDVDLVIETVSQSSLACVKSTQGAGKWADYKVLNCKLTKDLERDKDARYAFTYTYTNKNIKDKNADRKSVILVGFVNYDYVNSYSKDLMIARTPEQ